MMKKTLHVFDMDDCLLDTPMMVDFINTDENGFVINPDLPLRSHMKELSNSALILFSKELNYKRSGDFIVVIDKKDNNPLELDFIQLIEALKKEDMKSFGLPERTLKEMKRAVSIKNGVVALEPFGGFHGTTRTVGSKVNSEVISIYNSVENKMILTGREDDMVKFEKFRKKKEAVIKKITDKWNDTVDRASTLKEKIVKMAKPNQSDHIQGQIDDKKAGLINMKLFITNRIKELGVEYPNYGLMLYDGNGGISKFKSKTIEKTIINNRFTEVHYYEDRKDWLDSAGVYLREVLPEIVFTPHFITNVKDGKTL